ncbi:MAG TPA: hypothetical protein VIA18_12975 [Polyangia bacterium]|nr:hypothetical protein [Polyangia bacterium]
MRHLAVLTLVCSLSFTFAGRARADETEMVPVYTDTPPPRPAALTLASPALSAEPPRPHARRRKAELIAGGLMLGVGAILTGAGAALFVSGQRDQAACNSNPDPPFLCGLGGAFDQGFGTVMLYIGAPHVVAGIVAISIGAADTH